MKPASGCIPEEIAIITGESRRVQVGCPWDMGGTFSYNEDEDEVKKDLNDDDVFVDVLPAFISDAASPKSIATGKAWASRGNYMSTAPIEAKVETRKNIPIKNVRICSLESRGQGGTVYKVIADGFFVDCREDVIIDAILQEGVEKGGILNGEYIWTKLGAQSRLVRIGSTIHKRIALMNSRRNLKKIDLKELVPGTIYATKKDKRMVFIGAVNSTELIFERAKGYDAHVEFSDLIERPIKKQYLFIDIPECHEKNVEKFVKTMFKDKEIELVGRSNYQFRMTDPFYWTQFIKTSSVVDVIDKVDVTGVVDKLRHRSRQEIKKYCTFLANKKTPEGWGYTKDHFISDLSMNSLKANMHESTASPVPMFDWEALVTFI